MPGIGLISFCAKFDFYAALFVLPPGRLIQFGPRGTIFRNACVARLGGRRLDQTATIFRVGFGAESERYSGCPRRAAFVAIAGISERPKPAQTSDCTVSSCVLRKLMLGRKSRRSQNRNTW